MTPYLGHGDAERMYDFCVLNGWIPAPWQLEVLREMEQRSMDAQFAHIVSVGSDQ